MRSASTITLLSVLAIMLLSAPSAFAVVLSVGNNSCDQGATVQIPITVDAPSAIAGAAFTVTYDSANLTLTNVGSAFFDTFTNQWIALDPQPDPLPPDSVDVGGQPYDQPLILNDVAGGTMIAAARCQSGETSLTLFTLTFTVDITAPFGDYTINIIPSNINNTDAGYDVGGENIPYLVGAIDGEADLTQAFPVIEVTQVNYGILTVQGNDTDTDGDGLTDDDENNIYGTDPNKSDTDNDGIQDGTELGITMDDIGPDTDTSIFQPDLDPTTTTDPLDNDTDNDLIPDGMEDANHNGVVDSGETDPYNADTDNDGHNDGEEVNAGSNPLNKLSYPATTTIQLRKGFNLIAIPVEIKFVSDIKDWLPMLGDSTDIEKVLVYDDLDSKFVTLIPDSASNPSFILKGGEGLIVYAKQDKEIIFTSVLCPTLDLKSGFNLVGFACPANGYSAYQLLNDLGSENVSSIQRYSTENGVFETASFRRDGQPMGVDFVIVPGEGYFVLMHRDVLQY
jgi:hypothetical protein